MRYLRHDRRRGSLWTRPERRASDSDREAGFTLVEVLVVLAIIGLIMGLVGPRVMSFLSDAKVKTAKVQIDTLTAAMDLFMIDVGRYPTAEEGLSALVQRPTNIAFWNGPYIKGTSVPLDPWGHPYLYRVPGKAAPFEILSTGPGNRDPSNASAQRK